jgi:hypothetical protein
MAVSSLIPVADGTIVQNDTLPVLQVKLVNQDGTPYNLTGATAKCRVKTISGAVIESDATITNAAGGLVEHAWSTNETNRAGVISVVFVVNVGGALLTFPAALPIAINVRASF